MIFNLFKNIESITFGESVEGAFGKTITEIQTVDGFINNSHRHGYDAQGAEVDYPETTVHVKPESGLFLRSDLLVKWAGESWHKIESISDGKDFDTGKLEFYRIVVDTQTEVEIEETEPEPEA